MAKKRENERKAVLVADVYRYSLEERQIHRASC